MAAEISVEGTAKSHPEINRLTTTIKTTVASHFRALGLTDPELSIVLTDDEHIRRLNETWRGIDRATDVLSFPLAEPFEFDESTPGAALGDIVISLPYAERTCADARHRDRVAKSLSVPPAELSWSLADEIAFLVIHGLLHLIGHDHAEPEEEARMRAEERRLWKSAQQQTD